jgi:hypothetical protein
MSADCVGVEVKSIGRLRGDDSSRGTTVNAADEHTRVAAARSDHL